MTKFAALINEVQDYWNGIDSRTETESRQEYGIVRSHIEQARRNGKINMQQMAVLLEMLEEKR